MILDKIITMASAPVRLRFLAMERSLRATGCDLPLWVIPYDDNLFELPPNAHWWEIKEISEWLKQNQANKMMKKYQCFTIKDYQYVDTDIIFLRNPIDVLKEFNGFITSCGHWRNPNQTYSDESLKLLLNKSTLWEKFVFNAGQFACDRELYTFKSLKETCEKKDFIYSCLIHPYHDQTGLNMLVNATDVPIVNVTLPPFSMESTWAGDYNDSNYDKLWIGPVKPYIIHWAGCEMDISRPIDDLFLNYLKIDEKKQWDNEVKLKSQIKRSFYSRLRVALRKFKRTLT